MKRKSFVLVAAIAALTSTIAIAQGPGPGGGPGSGPGAGPGAGMGMGPGGGMRGRWQRFGASNTRGWSLMTPAERSAHRDKMRGLKTFDECKSYSEEHRKTMEARAREKGMAVPGAPRVDMCERMKQRGFFDQAPKK